MQGRRRETRHRDQSIGADRLPGLLVPLHRVAHLRQPHDRARLADRQINKDGRDSITEDAGVSVGANAHRHHRPHRRGRSDRLAAKQQPSAQCARDGGEDDVIDRAAVLLAYQLVVIEGGPGHPVPTLLTDCGVQRRRRRRRDSHPGGRRDASDDAQHTPDGGARVVQTQPDRVEHRTRAVHDLGESAGEQLRRTWFRFRHPQIVRHVTRRGGHVENHVADLDRADAVDHRVVRLGDYREAAALEAFDEVHLPQRTVAVQRPGLDPRAELAQLLVRAWAGKCGTAHVVGDVEVGIVDPDRIGEVTGYETYFLPVARNERDSFLDQVDQPLVVEAIGRQLEDSQPADVHGRGTSFEVEERHIHGRKAVGHQVRLLAGGAPHHCRAMTRADHASWHANDEGVRVGKVRGLVATHGRTQTALATCRGPQRQLGREQAGTDSAGRRSRNPRITAAAGTAPHPQPIRRDGAADAPAERPQARQQVRPCAGAACWPGAPRRVYSRPRGRRRATRRRRAAAPPAAVRRTG